MKRILIINGPNLNLLGKREPLLYGSESFESFFDALKSEYTASELAYVQCNEESDLIETI
ncbi:MAG: type II 3-dehydroquinate dehydratase, partial [Bacteroidota bacterium]